MAQNSFGFNAPTNPILQILYFVVGGVVLIGAILMGAIVLAVALGFAIIIGLVILIRIWWFKYKFGTSRQGADANGDVIEVEYTVVEERDERGQQD